VVVEVGLPCGEASHGWLGPRCGECSLNDLVNCPGDGLVVGAPNITVNLNGHTLDGIGLGAGVRNDGHASAVEAKMRLVSHSG
jgi:hypothetical protein